MLVNPIEPRRLTYKRDREPGSLFLLIKSLGVAAKLCCTSLSQEIQSHSCLIAMNLPPEAPLVSLLWLRFKDEILSKHSDSDGANAVELTDPTYTGCPVSRTYKLTPTPDIYSVMHVCDVH